MNGKSLAQSAVLGAIALGVWGTSDRALAAKQGMEKCAGIARAGKNDCGTSKHSCAGNAKLDGEKDEWIYVPIGTCEKIVGGRVVKPAAK